MKKVLVVCVVVCVLFAAVPTMATILVDFGTVAGETVAGVTFNGWGQIEPMPAGHGNYGGFGGGNDNYVAPTTPTADHLCRMVWGTSEDTAGFWAEVIFDTSISSVTIRHLDGTVGDDFDLHVDGQFWGHYTSGYGVAGEGKDPSFSPAEQWFENTYSGIAGKTLRITATAPSNSWRTSGWGQLGIDRLEATPVPEPATMLLLGLGGLLLRKRKNIA